MYDLRNLREMLCKELDEIAEKPPTGIENAAFERRVSLEDAKAKYDAWRSRTRFPQRKDAAKAPEKPPEEPKNQPETPKNPDNRVKASDRMKRLALLK